MNYTLVSFNNSILTEYNYLKYMDFIMVEPLFNNKLHNLLISSILKRFYFHLQTRHLWITVIFKTCFIQKYVLYSVAFCNVSLGWHTNVIYNVSFHGTKKEIFQKKICDIFPYICSIHRLWLLMKKASLRWFSWVVNLCF